MGYYTHYSLDWKVPPDHAGTPRCEHAPAASFNFCPECGTPVGVITPDEGIIAEIAKGEYLLHALGLDGNGGERCDWREHVADMRKLSSVFPGVLFTLHGEGEEGGDLWRKYFLNGKMQEEKAQIVYGEFDEDKLT